MAIQRKRWLALIEEAWEKKPLIWLAGVRRVGKTVLCQSVSNCEYFDCELPRIRTLLAEPEDFFRSFTGKRRLIIDEVHRLPNPSEFLKIATDHFPNIQLIATGSSTLGISSKFRDTLTGRKRNIRLTPMTYQDLSDFNNSDLPYRFHRGGLPPFYLSKDFPEYDFQEWMDAYWSKDIQELFRLEKRASFQRFFELLLCQSGGIFEATSFTKQCEVSRPTIANYLKVFEATLVAHIVRPFGHNRSREIVAAPKVYAFDTGFICYYRGWRELRPDDLGLLWEHFVLNELQAEFQTLPILYWREKNGSELDFIIAQTPNNQPIAIECKWRLNQYKSDNFRRFRRRYPQGYNYCVVSDIDQTISRHHEDMVINIVNLPTLVAELKKLLSWS